MPPRTERETLQNAPSGRDAAPDRARTSFRPAPDAVSSGAAAHRAPFRRSARKPTPWLVALAFLALACAPELPLPLSQPAERAPEPASAPAPTPAPTPTPATDLAASPSASAADGLVYVVSVDPESPRRTDLWRARLSDGAVRPLIQTADRDEDQPDWSERASELVFEARPLPIETTRRGLVLWKDGRELALPGDRARRELWATWAPVGPRLAYIVRRLQPANAADPIRNGVAVVDLEAGGQTLLAGAEERGERYARPTFTPDGRLVAAEYRTRQPRTTRIVLLDGNGGEARPLTSEEYRAHHPHFTRDGRHLLFSRRDARGAPRDVMRIRADGSDPQLLFGTPESDDYLPMPSPTREEVAFLSDRDGKLDVFLVDVLGGPARNLTASLDVRVRKLRWSPDGERLALTAFRFDPDAPEAERPRANRRNVEVLVIDRTGRVLFQTSGFAPDWMPPWS